ATLAFVFGIDLYLHHKFLRTGGYNVWGYRGPAVGKKRPGETRLVMLGGSVTFGYGVSSDQTVPTYLEARLNDPPAPHPVSVVNQIGRASCRERVELSGRQALQRT